MFALFDFVEREVGMARSAAGGNEQPDDAGRRQRAAILALYRLRGEARDFEFLARVSNDSKTSSFKQAQSLRSSLADSQAFRAALPLTVLPLAAFPRSFTGGGWQNEV